MNPETEWICDASLVIYLFQSSQQKSSSFGFIHHQNGIKMKQQIYALGPELIWKVTDSTGSNSVIHLELHAKERVRFAVYRDSSINF